MGVMDKFLNYMKLNDEEDEGFYDDDYLERPVSSTMVSLIQPMPVLCDPARPSAVMPVQPSESQPANSDGMSYQAYSVKSNER